MSAEGRVFAYPCPTCGDTVTTGVAYRARLRYPCLACLRKQSGWTAPASVQPEVSA